jgi:hypothetical protein
LWDKSLILDSHKLYHRQVGPKAFRTTTDGRLSCQRGRSKIKIRTLSSGLWALTSRFVTWRYAKYAATNGE